MTDTRPPSQLVAGDSWSWVSSLADFPAPTWSAVWYFENATDRFQVDGAASGSNHAAAATTSTTGGLKAGDYHWTLVVTAGTQRVTLAQGWTRVLPDPSAAGRSDHRSHARKVLAAIEAVLEGRASVDQAAVTINGRTLTRTPLPDLMALADRYRTLVANEDAADRASAGLPSRRNVYVRFY
jgi:hypothetical protein